MSEKPLHPRTRAVHHGIRRSQYGEMAEALFMTQGFSYDSAEQAEARFIHSGPDEFIYARYGNPTSRMFEDRIADLEGAEDAFATASGMAAVNGALMCFLKPGDHIVSAKALFGSCLYVLDVLARFGVQVSYVDGTDLAQWQAAIRPDTKAVFFETMSNPTLEIVDIEAVAKLAHAVGALVIVAGHVCLSVERLLLPGLTLLVLGTGLLKVNLAAQVGAVLLEGCASGDAGVQALLLEAQLLDGLPDLFVLSAQLVRNALRIHSARLERLKRHVSQAWPASPTDRCHR